MAAQSSSKGFAAFGHVDFNDFHDIPTATNTNAYCTLSIIKAGYAHAPAEVFLKDVPPNSFLDMPDYCFLIEKTINGSTRRFLFDLGLRKDGTPLSAQFAERRRILNFESPQGVDETLKANGVSLASLEGVIFSHTHWDHVGDIGRFPKEVGVVLGLDSRDSLDELAVDLDVDQQLLEGRLVLTLNRDDFPWQNIGSFEGVDFFKDGSMFLLNSPGHRKGHTSALVRISAEGTGLYCLLGGDTCHSIYLLDGRKPVGEWPGADGALRTVHDNLEDAYKSMARTRRMEKEANVLTMLAHDTTLKAFMEDKGYFYRLPSDEKVFKTLKSRLRQDPTVSA